MALPNMLHTPPANSCSREEAKQTNAAKVDRLSDHGMQDFAVWSSGICGLKAGTSSSNPYGLADASTIRDPSECRSIKPAQAVATRAGLLPYFQPTSPPF